MRVIWRRRRVFFGGGLLGMRSPGDTRLLIDGVARSGAIAECLNAPAPKRPARVIAEKNFCVPCGARPLWAALCTRLNFVSGRTKRQSDAGHFLCSALCTQKIWLWKVCRDQSALWKHLSFWSGTMPNKTLWRVIKVKLFLKLCFHGAYSLY